MRRNLSRRSLLVNGSRVEVGAALLPVAASTARGQSQSPIPSFDVNDLLGPNWGRVGRSYNRSRVTIPSYHNFLANRASRFGTRYGVGIEADPTQAIDLGGVWGNSLSMLAPVTGS